MKKAYTILLLLIPLYSINSKEVILTYKPKKVDFVIAYSLVRKAEGNYVNHPNDKGKRTYAGITSKYNPNWYGWRYIKHNPKWNTHIPKAEMWVLDYYLDIWIKEGFDELSNQELANYLFDTRINLSRKQTVKLLNKVFKINRINKDKWITKNLDTLNVDNLRLARIAYYNNIIKKDSSQIVFKKSWIKRAMQ